MDVCRNMLILFLMCAGLPASAREHEGAPRAVGNRAAIALQVVKAPSLLDAAICEHLLVTVGLIRDLHTRHADGMVIDHIYTSNM